MITETKKKDTKIIFTTPKSIVDKEKFFAFNNKIWIPSLQMMLPIYRFATGFRKQFLPEFLLSEVTPKLNYDSSEETDKMVMNVIEFISAMQPFVNCLISYDQVTKAGEMMQNLLNQYKIIFQSDKTVALDVINDLIVEPSDVSLTPLSLLNNPFFQIIRKMIYLISISNKKNGFDIENLLFQGLATEKQLNDNITLQNTKRLHLIFGLKAILCFAFDVPISADMKEYLIQYRTQYVDSLTYNVIGDTNKNRALNSDLIDSISNGENVDSIADDSWNEMLKVFLARMGFIPSIMQCPFFKRETDQSIPFPYFGLKKEGRPEEGAYLNFPNNQTFEELLNILTSPQKKVISSLLKHHFIELSPKDCIERILKMNYMYSQIDDEDLLSMINTFFAYSLSYPKARAIVFEKTFQKQLKDIINEISKERVHFIVDIMQEAVRRNEN